MSTIKISELATSAISLSDFFAKADANGVANKNTVQGLSNVINTSGSSVFRGSLAISDTPTLDGWYFPSESGTYANAGGVVVALLNNLNIIIISGTQTVFELLIIPVNVSLQNDVFNVLDAVNGASMNLTNEFLKTKSILDFGKNLYDKDSLIAGSFINKNTGVITANSGYSYIFIELEKNTDYNWSVSSADSNLEQFAFYDLNLDYISGSSGAAQTISFSTGNNIRNIGLSINNSKLASLYQFEKGTSRSLFNSYHSPSVLFSNLPKYINKDLKRVITVDLNGGSDFTNLRFAVESCTDSSIKYEIQIKEGVYDVLALYAEGEINASTFKGLPIYNNVSLIGIGDYNEVILKGELSTITYSGTTRARVSTINFEGSGDLENLKVTGLDVRYAVHDDVSAGVNDVVRNVNNCVFYKFNGSGYNQAYGAGTRSGGVYVFNNCYAYTEELTESFSFHNNTSFVKKSILRLINCQFDNSHGNVALRIGSLGSGLTDILEVVGCKFNGKIRMMEEVAGSGLDYKLIGSGNDVVPVLVETTTSQQYTYELEGQSIKKINKGSLDVLKGDALKQASNGFEKMGSADNYSLFYGVALNDTTQNSSGFVTIGGYLAVSDTGLTGLSIGDKIGITNGVLAVVSTDNYIGVYAFADYITLK
tara:strand:+ start:23 stop:1975 length:1953 start_codon:yes stop_codon:yes gene_type:complete